MVTKELVKPKKTTGNLAVFITRANIVLLLLVTFYFLVFPALVTIFYSLDPAIREGRVSRSAVQIFKTLTPRYEKWAEGKIALGIESRLNHVGISGTEWPPFGTAFYLWGVESLQEAWDKGDHFMKQAPKDYARGAIEASVAVILDPKTAGWVKDYWGENYLHRENVFYRMLIISAVTSYQKLTGDKRYLAILKDQVETLSLEIDKSPFGLLDDYPGQCFPADVVAAVAAIRRADILLGTNHSDFAARAERGFKGLLADERGLPPYMADSKSGKVLGPSRGCSNSYICLFAPEAWPRFSSQLYSAYDNYFWQEKWGAFGFREFPKDLPGYNWYMDVDAGPVVAGHGISACAFGLGAALVNGRLDHAFPLIVEALAFSWPLPDGTLMIPRILSNGTDVPFVGEAGILYNLSRLPAAGVDIKIGGSFPPVVIILLLLQLSSAFLILIPVFKGFKDWKSGEDSKLEDCPKFHLVIWIVFVTIALAGIVTVHLIAGLVFFAGAQIFPIKAQKTVIR